MKRNEAEIITANVVGILEAERLARGITKLQIAKTTGLSRTAITLIVEGKNSPTLRTLLMLTSALKIDIKDIIRRAENQATSSKQH